MTAVSAADLRSRIAAEFDRRAWPYEPGIGDRLLGDLAPGTSIEPAALARRLPADYLDRNGITRAQVAAALAGLGDLTLLVTPPARTLIVNDNRYQVTLSDQAQISDSSVNLGGGQINVSVETPKEDVITAVRLLLAAAFAGDWNDVAVGDLSRLIDGRDDITVDDISRATVEVGVEQKVEAGRIRGLLDKVATGALSGTLSAGLSAGFGQLLESL